MELKDLLPAGIAIVVAGIGISIGAEISSNTAGRYTDNCTADAQACKAHGVADNTTEGLSEMGSWFGTLGLVVAAAVVIGTLFMAFYFRNR